MQEIHWIQKESATFAAAIQIRYNDENHEAVLLVDAHN